MQKLTARKVQAINTKKRILDKAMEILSEKPYDEVTIQEICRKAGVSTGAFYHYFDAKERLLVEQFIRVDKELGGPVETLKADTVCGRIQEYMGLYAQSAEKDGVRVVTEVYRVWMTLGEPFPDSKEYGVTPGLMELIREGKERGELIGEVDQEALAEDLLAITRGIVYHWCQTRGAYPLRPRVERIIRIFMEHYCRSRGER